MTRKLIDAIVGKIRKLLKRELKSTEISYIKGQSRRVIRNNPPVSYPELIPVLIEELLNDLNNPSQISDVLAEPEEVDIHRLLNNEINIDSLKVPEPPKNVIHCNIASIFSTTDREKLLYMFNPAMSISTTYLLLDRKYHMRTNTDNKKFSWNISHSTGYDNANTVVTNSPLKNIIYMKAKAFRFPNTTNSLQFQNRISLTIEELSNQAIVANENRKRIHFLYTISETTPGSSNAPLTMINAESDDNEFWFPGIVQDLPSITISFGNPFRDLILDPDILPATISADGVETKLTFTTPHNVSDGEYITISNFATDSPSADTVEIALMNDVDGWMVDSSTATTLNILVDISGLAGSINSNPSEIYFESKRFIIPLEFKYLRRI